MQIRQPKNKKILWIIVGVVTAILLTALTLYVLKLGPFSQQSNISKGNAPATAAEKQASDTAKQQAVTNATTQGKNQNNSDTPPAPQPIPGSNKSSVVISIPSTLQNGANIHISTLISAVVNSGTCTLTLTMPQQSTYTISAGVQTLSTTSTCEGFDVPTSKLAPGTWTATLNFSNDTLQGSTTKSVAVQ